MVITAQDQLDLFAGCVYVLSENRVRMPDGKLLDQKRFNVEFKGPARKRWQRPKPAFRRSRLKRMLGMEDL